MKTLFLKDGVVVSHGSTYDMGATVSCNIPGATGYDVADDSPVDTGWTYTEVAGMLEFVPPAIAYPKVGPIAFQMLFTPQEMIAADELKATDKVLASFWKLIDDPRTDIVDLGLSSVQNAIEYTLTAIKGAGVAVDVPARKAAILSGVLQ